MKGRANLYYQDRDANFSGPGQLTPGVGVRQEGGAVNLPVSASTQVAGKFDSTDSTIQTLRSGEFGVEHKLDEHWRVAVGARVDDRENTVPNASAILSQNGQRTDVALTVGYQPTAAPSKAGGADSAPSAATAPSAVAMPIAATVPSAATAPGADMVTASASGRTTAAPTKRPDWDVYGFVQGTAEHTETRPDNDRLGMGGSYQVSDALRLGAEASGGNLGLGAKASTDYRIDDRSNVYLNYTLAADQPDALNVGRNGTLTAGTRYRYSDATSVYGGERMMTGTGSDSLTRAYGVDFSPNKYWTYGLKFEHGTISDPLAGDLALSAVTASLGYSREKIKYSGALEWREDDSSVTGASRTKLTRNIFDLSGRRRLAAFRQAQLVADRRCGGFSLARRLSRNRRRGGVAPSAQRPLEHLVQVLYHTRGPALPCANQFAGLLDRLRRNKSRVFDTDTTYQATSWFSVGAKYAIRTGELKSTAPGGDWFASQAQLWIARGDFLLPRKWDGMVELRRLEVRETDDHRTGCLLGLYRHIGDHLKLGAGYNFTNYSDNLTDLSYRSHRGFRQHPSASSRGGGLRPGRVWKSLCRRRCTLLSLLHYSGTYEKARIPRSIGAYGAAGRDSPGQRCLWRAHRAGDCGKERA